MSPDMQPSDLVEEVLRGRVSSQEVRLDLIDACYERVARRDRRRRIGIAAAAMALVVAIVIPLGAHRSNGAVEVDQPSGKHHPSAPHTPTSIPGSTSTTFGSIVIAPAAQPRVETPGTTPAPAAPTDRVAEPGTSIPSAPTTTTTVSDRRATSTTSTTIASPYPPLIDGLPRITMVLDDSGLHGPATVTVTPDLNWFGSLEILLLDQRSDKFSVAGNATSYLVSTDGAIFVASWDGSKDELVTTSMQVGHTYTLQAQDGSSYTDIPGATATLTIVPG